MATIWEGTHLTLNRPIALKFVELGPNTSKMRARFLREARVAAAVRHRNVVDIVDFGTTDDGRPFMVMELLVGSTLAERLDSGPPMSVAESVRVMARVLSGLAAVHDAGVIHRDLKPENIFLVEDADGTYPKLLDFGVSRAMDPHGELTSVLPTVENAIVGTPQYMSPEQARGLRSLDHRSDLWSAGVILFELLTGVLPFQGDAVGDIIVQIATHKPPEFGSLRPDLVGPLELVVKRAMERRPEQRFQSAREMRSALLSAVAQTAAAMRDAAHRAPSRIDSISDAPPSDVRELFDAVGDAYEPGDSSEIEISHELTPSRVRSRAAVSTTRDEERDTIAAKPPRRSHLIGAAAVGLALVVSVVLVLVLAGAHGPTAKATVDRSPPASAAQAVSAVRANQVEPSARELAPLVEERAVAIGTAVPAEAEGVASSAPARWPAPLAVPRRVRPPPTKAQSARAEGLLRDPGL